MSPDTPSARGTLPRRRECVRVHVFVFQKKSCATAHEQDIPLALFPERRRWWLERMNRYGRVLHPVGDPNPNALSLLQQQEARRQKPRSTDNRTSWIETDAERASAAGTMSISFLATVLIAILSGVTTLLWAPRDDVAFEGLNTRLSKANHNVTCLRAARRADYAVVFVGLGSPSQYLKLLLRLDQTRASASTEPLMTVFS